jgi:N-acetylglucosaminyl-diphospho-decaprenol L-rhamnosyltransferase
MSNITISIVTYNSSQVIAKCLSSLTEFDVYIVDNASTDDTIKIVESNFPNVQIIKCQKNIGFGPAHNLVLRQIDAKYCLILNPDAYIDAQNINNLIMVAEKYQDAALIAPILFDFDGNKLLTHKNNVFKREKSRCNNIIPEGELCAEYLSGAVLLANLANIKKAGLFDDNIFLFYEDDDLCIKNNLNRCSNILTNQASAIHGVGKSSGDNLRIIYIKNYFMTKSRIYLQKKYFGKNSAMIMSFKLAIICFCKTILYLLIFNRSKLVKSYAKMLGALKPNLY